MLISIIIPVYNDQKGLNSVLSHLASQTMSLSDYEVIVIDNNSIPSIKECQNVSIPHKIYVCSKAGSYAARNFGAERSKGAILVFLDAGCYPSPQWLKAGVAAVLKYKNSAIGGEVLFEKSPKPTTVELYQYLTGIENSTTIQKKGYTGAGNMFTTSSIFNAVGDFDENLFSGGDKEWCWRAEKKGVKIRFCPEAVVYTNARRTLSKAITQARRIAGGRKQLERLESLSLENKHNIAPNRNPFQSIGFIFSQNELSYFTKIRIFCVASILKMAHVVETIRLSLCSDAERR